MAPDAASPRELIYIKHPDVAAPGGPVTRKALKEVLSHQGWTELSTDEASAEEEARRVAQITGKKVQDVRGSGAAKTKGA